MLEFRRDRMWRPMLVLAALLLPCATVAQDDPRIVQASWQPDEVAVAPLPVPSTERSVTSIDVQRPTSGGDGAAERNEALLNGALIALGTLGVVDNVVIHWMLGWHRAIEGSPYSLHVEIGVVAVSAAMLAAGILRERRARDAITDR